MKKIIVLIIASILLSSGILVGAGAIEDNHQIESNQSKLEKTQFNKLFQNFLERIIEHFPVFKEIFDIYEPKYETTNTCLVNLPTYQVTMVAEELQGVGWPAFFRTTLSGVGSGYDVSDGTYEGWCIDYGTAIPEDPLLVTLYSSYCPPNHLDFFPEWNKINYIINNKVGNAWDIQIAIWNFINLGPTTNKPITGNAQTMIDGANLNPGFIPIPGKLVAVICDPPTPGEDREFQYTFIEVPIPEPYEGLTPGFWKNKGVRVGWPSPYIPKGPSATTLGDAGFVIPGGSMTDNIIRPVYPDDTLIKALSYKGGKDVSGMAQILLRAATAALLNAAHPEVNYPLTVTEVISQVNTALATEDRDTMELLKNDLDGYNNLKADEWW